MLGDGFSVGGASSGSNKWKQCTTTNDCITHYKKAPYRNAAQAANMNNPCKRTTDTWTFFNAKEQTNRMCMGGYCNCDSGWNDDDTSPRPPPPSPPPAPTTTPRPAESDFVLQCDSNPEKVYDIAKYVVELCLSDLA